MRASSRDREWQHEQLRHRNTSGTCRARRQAFRRDVGVRNRLLGCARKPRNHTDPDFVLVDVRGANAFAQGHVEGAINIPHREMTAIPYGGPELSCHCAVRLQREHGARLSPPLAGESWRGGKAECLPRHRRVSLRIVSPSVPLPDPPPQAGEGEGSAEEEQSAGLTSPAARTPTTSSRFRGS